MLDKLYKAVKCPVCSSKLGQRDPKSVFIAHCDECMAEVEWVPGAVKPKMTLDKHKSKRRCGCGCGR